MRNLLAGLALVAAIFAGSLAPNGALSPRTALAAGCSGWAAPGVLYQCKMFDGSTMHGGWTDSSRSASVVSWTYAGSGWWENGNIVKDVRKDVSDGYLGYGHSVVTPTYNPGLPTATYTQSGYTSICGTYFSGDSGPCSSWSWTTFGTVHCPGDNDNVNIAFGVNVSYTGVAYAYQSPSSSAFYDCL